MNEKNWPDIPKWQCFESKENSFEIETVKSKIYEKH